MATTCLMMHIGGGGEVGGEGLAGMSLVMHMNVIECAQENLLCEVFSLSTIAPPKTMAGLRRKNIYK